jgi:hypothetical protein
MGQVDYLALMEKLSKEQSVEYCFLDRRRYTYENAELLLRLDQSVDGFHRVEERLSRYHASNVESAKDTASRVKHCFDLLCKVSN